MSLYILGALALMAVFTYTRLNGGNRMSQTALKEHIAAGATILDVRSPAEFRSGAYPGALNIPLGELGRRLGEISQDRPVVIYCASGARSTAAAQVLKQAGLAQVFNAGGLGHMPR